MSTSAETLPTLKDHAVLETTTSSTASTTAPPLLPWYKRVKEIKGFLLALTSMAMMLDVINVASVTIVLPDLMVDVGYEPNQLQWVVSAYALAYSGFLLLGGRLGDLFGHRRIFLLGVSWFTIWSLINGFANTPVFMSVGRALQGMGAGFTIPSALALLTTTFPAGPERTQAIAIFGGSGAVGSVLGVLLGGIFGSTIGWRWIFFITAIIAGIVAVSSYFIIPYKTHTPPEDRRIDYAGAFSFTTGIVLIIYYLSESPSSGWSVAKTLAPFLVGIALLIAFVIIEMRIEYPIMPFRIFKSRRFVASSLTAVCISMSIQTMIYFSSLSLQNIMGYSSLITACCYIVHGFGLIIGVGVLTKFLYPRIRSKILLSIGWLFVVASGVLWAQNQPGDSYWKIAFPALILNFIGMVPLWVLSQVNSVLDANDDDQGVVGAVYNVALQVGGPIGIAIATVVVNTIIDPYDQGAALVPGYRAAFYCMAGYSGLGFIIVILLAVNQDPLSQHAPDAIASKMEDTEAGAIESVIAGQKAELDQDQAFEAKDGSRSTL